MTTVAFSQLTRAEIEKHIHEAWDQCKFDGPSLDFERPVADQGLDSFDRLELVAKIIDECCIPGIASSQIPGDGNWTLAQIVQHISDLHGEELKPDLVIGPQ